MSKRKIRAADLFCGGGGTSQGLLMAANEMNVELELIAINHWSVAIDTHSANHPYAKHLCTGLDEVDPIKLVPGGRLQLMCASPECTHHSNARGGKPMNDQSRSSAWHVLRFAEKLYIDNIIIENVKEFQSWGPLGANGRPLESKKGQLFQQFIESLKALDYRVDWRVLTCADYGDPTTRERLFIMARRGNKPIRWPEPTHVPASHIEGLFTETRKPWRTAREIIDWSIQGKSIFGRKKPLADNTLLRIEAGLRKFCGIDVDLRKCVAENLRPFIVVLRNHCDALSIDEPLPTITASGQHVGLVEPFPVLFRKGQGPREIDEPLATLTTKGANYGVAEPLLYRTDCHHCGGKLPLDYEGPCVHCGAQRCRPGEPFLLGQQSCAAPRSAEQAVPTVAAAGAISLIEPFVLPHPRKNDQPHSVDQPVRTVTATSCDLSIAEPFIVPQFSENGPRSVDKPLGTLTTTSRGVGLAEAFVMPTDQTGRGPNVARPLDRPVGTIVTKANQSMVEPYIVTVTHQGSDRVRSVDAPLGTVTGSMGEGVCQPFLIEYYGSQNMSEMDQPLPTCTTKERFGLVETNVDRYMLDIRFRMLSPRELARAQGFPDDYKFVGNREEVVKQIGNAVPPHTAHALIREVLA